MRSAAFATINLADAKFLEKKKTKQNKKHYRVVVFGQIVIEAKSCSYPFYTQNDLKIGSTQSFKSKLQCRKEFLALALNRTCGHNRIVCANMQVRRASLVFSPDFENSHLLQQTDRTILSYDLTSKLHRRGLACKLRVPLKSCQTSFSSLSSFSYL